MWASILTGQTSSSDLSLLALRFCCGCRSSPPLSRPLSGLLPLSDLADLSWGCGSRLRDRCSLAPRPDDRLADSAAASAPASDLAAVLRWAGSGGGSGMRITMPPETLLAPVFEPLPTFVRCRAAGTLPPALPSAALLPFPAASDAKAAAAVSGPLASGFTGPSTRVWAAVDVGCGGSGGGGLTAALGGAVGGCECGGSGGGGDCGRLSSGGSGGGGTGSSVAAAAGLSIGRGGSWGGSGPAVTSPAGDGGSGGAASDGDLPCGSGAAPGDGSSTGSGGGTLLGSLECFSCGAGVRSCDDNCHSLCQGTLCNGELLMALKAAQTCKSWQPAQSQRAGKVPSVLRPRQTATQKHMREHLCCDLLGRRGDPLGCRLFLCSRTHRQGRRCCELSAVQRLGGQFRQRHRSSAPHSARQPLLR